MINISKLAKEIIQEETPAEPDTVVTSVPQEEIDSALELANQLRELANNLLAELDLAVENLSGNSSPSVLESKDDFKSLTLKLKNMKRKLSLV